MSRKKTDVFSQVIVGVFMVAVLAVLVYFTIVISGVDILRGRQKIEVRIAFTDVGGLKERDNVMYRGTKVGTVSQIDLSPSNLIVHAQIDRNVVLRETSQIEICNLSMLGGNYLHLIEGEGAILPIESMLLTGDKPTDWMRDVSGIARNLNEIIAGGELKSILTNVEVAAASVRKVVDRVERGEGTIGKLLSTNDTVYAGVETTVSNLTDITTRLNEGKGTMGQLLSSDSTLYFDLKKTISNAQVLSDRLVAGEGLIGRLMNADDPIAKEVEDAVASFRKACDSFDAKEVLAKAESLMASLQGVADDLSKGKGTLGRLITDDSLYQEVDGLTKDIRQVLDNYRDTTPISTFGSLILGGL